MLCYWYGLLSALDADTCVLIGLVAHRRLAQERQLERVEDWTLWGRL